MRCLALYSLLNQLVTVLVVALCSHFACAEDISISGRQDGFQCSHARTSVEQMICQNSQLIDLHNQITEAFKQSIQASPDPIATGKEQRLWLWSVHNRCKTETCLLQSYHHRLVELQRHTKADVPSQSILTQDSVHLVPATESSPIPPFKAQNRFPDKVYEPPSQTVASYTTPRPIKHHPVSEWEKMKNDGLLILFVASVLAFFALLILGFTNRVVIFYDWYDLLYCVGIVIVFPLMWLMQQEMESIFFKWVILIISIGVLVFSIVMTFYNAMRYNKPLLGFFVGCLKVIVSLLAVSLILMSGSSSDGKKSSNKNYIFLLIGMLAWLFFMLVNGKRVEARMARMNDQRKFNKKRHNEKTRYRSQEHEQTQSNESSCHHKNTNKDSEDITPRPWNEVLGVAENASNEEIKIAWKRKMSQYHPDKTSGLGPELKELAEAKATEINVAYEFICKIRGAA